MDYTTIEATSVVINGSRVEVVEESVRARANLITLKPKTKTLNHKTTARHKGFAGGRGKFVLL